MSRIISRHTKLSRLNSSLEYYKDLQKRWAESEDLDKKARDKRVNRLKNKVKKIKDEIKSLGE
jgi:uncharacterized protein YdcH (DUF465 family)